MADETRIINGFYKGIQIAIRSGSISGGRKVAIKQFPSRDTQSIEDLGLIPRKYQLEIIISDKPDAEYFAYRDRLLAILDAPGPGILIHPLYGRIDDVVAVTYSLNESFDKFGSAIVSVNFEIDDNTGIPQSSGNVVTQIAQQNAVVQAAINSDVAENFSVTARFAGNFSAAVDKVNGIIDAADAATSFIGEAADTINQFSADLGELSANVNGLVSDPIALADAVGGLFENVNGLYESAQSTIDTFFGFFDFGDDDTETQLTTAGLLERQRNNSVLNGAINIAALGYAYQAATQLDFQTTDEINDLASQLDDQYWKTQENGSDQAVKDALTDLRVLALQALDQARLTASSIITVETKETSARLLAFSYYGSDELGETIANQNNITDLSFIEGNVEILSA